MQKRVISLFICDSSLCDYTCINFLIFISEIILLCMYIQCNLSKLNLIGTNFCAWNRQVLTVWFMQIKLPVTKISYVMHIWTLVQFQFIPVKLTRISYIGLYLKFSLKRIPVYWRSSLDRLHCMYKLTILLSAISFS
jgi:hypothetical protein